MAEKTSSLDPRMLAILLGGQLLSGLFGGGPDFQERASFRERVTDPHSTVDPRTLLAQAKTAILRLGAGLTDWAEQPLSVPGAFVQPLPTFTSPWLPFPVGVTARDPGAPSLPALNLFNPFHRETIPTGIARRPPARGVFTGDDTDEAVGAIQLLLESGRWPGKRPPAPLI